MNPIDLRIVMFALRDQLVDPVRLAQVALKWSPSNGPLTQHLLDNGVLNDEQLRRLAEALDDTPEEISNQLISTLTHQSVVADAANSSQSTKQNGSSAVLGEHDETLLFTGNSEPATNHMNPPPSGRYEPVSFHRKGGLGQVWRARDTLLGREVALKSIRLDRYDSPNAVGMFTNEAKVTGCLEHPCIVPLYDYVPQSNGNGPWYVMKFVTGQTLHEATQVYHKRRRAKDTKPLDLVVLLDAFLGVCRAVAFAHDRGVLHRDLKGQNVILGKFGEVFLLDWGLAKQLKLQSDGTANPYLLDPDQSDSVTGTVMGTPAFMCPQVAAGKHATKLSDVYGLGAILYSILTGHSPTQPTVPQNAFQQMAQRDPPCPQSLNPGVSPALAAVCLKAMSFLPEDRYSSANDLATDVRSWLADEPVAARPDSVPQRVARWANHHRTFVATSVAILATALVAAMVTTGLVWQAQQATSAALVKADDNFKKAESERAKANANFITARTMLVDNAKKLSEIETGRSTTKEVDKQRWESIEKAISDLQGFQDQTPNDTELQQQLGQLHRYSGNVARLMNNTKAADVSYLASIKLWERLIAEYPNSPNAQSSLAATLYDYASMQRRVGQLASAAKNLERAEQLMNLAQEKGIADSTFARTMGTVTLQSAAVDYLRGDYDQSRAKTQRATKLYQGLQENRFDANQQVLHKMLLASALTEFAITQRDTNNDTEALKALDEAMTTLEKTETTPAMDRDLRFIRLLVRLEHARTLAKQPSQLSSSVADLKVVIDGIETMQKEFPQTPLYKEWLAASYLTRGECYLTQLQSKNAEDDLKKAQALLIGLRAESKEISEYRYLLGRTEFAFHRLYTTVGKQKETLECSKNIKTLLDNGYKNDPDNVLYRKLRQEFDRASSTRP